MALEYDKHDSRDSNQILYKNKDQLFLGVMEDLFFCICVATLI